MPAGWATEGSASRWSIKPDARRCALRDDGAAPHTETHAFRKAYTALTYKMPSAEYGKRLTELRGLGPVLLPNITTAAGGVPIRQGERVLGAIGISGTPGSAGRRRARREVRRGGDPEGEVLNSGTEPDLNRAPSPN